MVERWSIDGTTYCPIKKSDGAFVRHSDYAALEAQLSEMTRRRDEWRAKAEGYDEVRIALRKKVGTPWPPNMSRALWAGIAADEKKRADDAEARLSALEATPSAPKVTEAEAGAKLANAMWGITLTAAQESGQ